MNTVIVVAAVVVATGFLTIFYQSFLIAIGMGGGDDAILKRRFTWIINGALLQAVLQIGLISMMAYWVVFQ